jgi:hypothetical protein
MNKKLSVLGAAIAMSVSVNAQAAFISYVDLFTAAQSVQDVLDDSTAVSSHVSDALSIMGTERDVSVDLVNDLSGTLNDGDRSRINVNGGTLAFSNDNLLFGEGIVQWDGVDGSMNLNKTGLGGLDLIAAGANAFQYEVINTDLGFLFSIELYSDAGNFTKAMIKTDAATLETIPFADLQNGLICGYDFSTHGVVPGVDSAIQSITCGGDNVFGDAVAGNTVNLASLGAIQAILNVGGATGSVDLRIGRVVTVPEPSVIGLVGMGLLAAGFAGKRRSNQGAFQA